MVRVMPNTPAVVQSACSVFARGSHVEDEDADRVTEMLNCVGLVEEMPEHLMDAVTGLSGNGPAYVSHTVYINVYNIYIYIIFIYTCSNIYIYIYI